jgi:hypothetical protein
LTYDIDGDTLSLANTSFVLASYTFVISVSDSTATLTLTDGVSTIIVTRDISLTRLPGSITISPNMGVTAGTQLTANYSGSETVTFQRRGGTIIAEKTV